MAKREGLGSSLASAKDAIASKKRRGKGHAPKARKGKDWRAQREIDQAMSAADQRAVDLVVPKAAQRHGKYELVDFKIEEVVEGGKIKAKTAKAIRNLGGTPVERWHARGSLDDRQMAGILFYQNAWRVWIGEPRVVANWSAVIVRSAQGACEIYAGTKMAAKESLRLLDQEIFFRLPVEHFHVWQNVVIWDEPAGVAGGRVGFSHKPAEAAARLIVSIIAGMIADLVITDSPKEWGDLLLDIDAPRRPRGKPAPDSHWANPERGNP